MQTPVGLCLQGIGRSQDSASLGPEGGVWGWVGRRRLRAARREHGSTPAVDLGAMKLSRYQSHFPNPSSRTAQGGSDSLLG